MSECSSASAAEVFGLGGVTEALVGWSMVNRVVPPVVFTKPMWSCSPSAKSSVEEQLLIVLLRRLPND